MLNMLAERASGPARQVALFRRKISGKVVDWRRLRRRDQQLRMTHLAITSQPGEDRFREITFTFAVIAIAAKLAQADGTFREDEYAVFRQVFPMPDSEGEKIRQLFQSAREDATDALVYARQIAGLFPPRDNRILLRDVLLRLMKVAVADGDLDTRETVFLRGVGEQFGLKARELNRLLPALDLADPQNPYDVLQVKKSWSNQQIRVTYLRLIRDFHPDKVQARGASSDSIEAAGRHMAQLNAAYSSIARERGLKASN